MFNVLKRATNDQLNRLGRAFEASENFEMYWILGFSGSAALAGYAFRAAAGWYYQGDVIRYLYHPDDIFPYSPLLTLELYVLHVLIMVVAAVSFTVWATPSEERLELLEANINDEQSA